MLRALIHRLRGGPPPHAAPPPELVSPPPAPRDPRSTSMLLDASTWTFWSRGAHAAETLVEAASGPLQGDTVSRRVALLMARRELGHGTGSPQHDPTYTEVLFTELVRGRQYQRAFALLAPECQESWGSDGAFAAHHATASGRLLGVEVRGVRILREWTDPQAERVHPVVAELDVEYSIRTRDGAATVPRTVHLVDVDGGWRLLVYPA